MNLPSWAPVVLSGALPREFSDLLAIAILDLTSAQLVLSGKSPFSSNDVTWTLLLLVPLTCVLAALSNSVGREREELALIAYGGSTRQIGLGHMLRGIAIAVIGLLPVFYRILASTFSLSPGLIVLILLVVVGGSTYAIPAFRRTRSVNFAEQYKG